MAETESRNDIALREYVDMRINALEKAMMLQFESSRIAISKAEAAVDYRMAAMNEFRASLNDQTRLYVTRAELEAVKSTHEAEVKSLSKQVYLIMGAVAALQFLLKFFIP